jgi:hypothetical protein
MSNRYLIAFGKKPKDPKTFLDTVVNLAKNDGVTIAGAILTPGPGCSNLAIIVDSDDHKNFATQLTMALQPAKFEECTDPRLQAGEFVTEDFE